MRSATRASITKRLRQLAESEPSALKVGAPADIEMLFAPRVLSQLVWLQTELDRSPRVDRFLLAVLAGMLHGNADREGIPRGLSIAMPNTFAMAPQYVRGTSRSITSSHRSSTCSTRWLAD